MTKTAKRPRTTGFPVCLRVNLEYADGEIVLEKKLTLDFVPHAGLWMESTEDAELDTQVESVFYLTEEKSFLVLCHDLEREAWSMADALAISSREGWSVR